MPNETLIAQVKRKCNITWEDEDTTARIDEIIASAIPDMKHMLGIKEAEEIDFSKAGKENLLFLAYCLYEWNHVLPDFAVNYANDIAQVRAKWEVKYFSENSEGEEDA